MACQISSTGMHEEDYAVLNDIILFKSIQDHIDTPGFGPPTRRSAAVAELGQTSARHNQNSCVIADCKLHGENK